MTKKSPKPEVHDFIYRLTIVAVFIAVMGVGAVFLKKNLGQTAVLPGADFSDFKAELKQTFNAVKENYKNAGQVTEQPVEPVKAFTDNALKEIVSGNEVTSGEITGDEVSGDN